MRRTPQNLVLFDFRLRRASRPVQALHGAGHIPTSPVRILPLHSQDVANPKKEMLHFALRKPIEETRELEVLMVDLYRAVTGASRCLIIGSCVSQQLLARMFQSDIKKKFLWRMGTVSLMAPPPSEQYNFSDVGLSENEIMTVVNDFNKPFDIEDLIGWSDFVIMDFMRDVYDGLELANGGFATAGLEWETYNLMSERVPVARRVSFYSVEMVERWLEATLRLTKHLNAQAKPCLLIENQLAHFGFDGDQMRVIHPNNQWGLKLKGYLMRQYAHIMADLLDNAVLLSAPSYAVYSTSENEYGLGEGHMGDVYFNGLVDDFYLKTGFSDERHDGANRAMRDRRCNYMIKKLLDHVRFGMPI